MRYEPHTLTIERRLRERLDRGDTEGAIRYAKQAVIESYRHGLQLANSPPSPKRRVVLFKFWKRRR